jgi:hypothetical protein
VKRNDDIDNLIGQAADKVGITAQSAIVTNLLNNEIIEILLVL